MQVTNGAHHALESVGVTRGAEGNDVLSVSDGNKEDLKEAPDPRLGPHQALQ